MTTSAHALATHEHSPVAGLAHDARGGISNPVLGMILFIASEVMFFAGLFAAYFNVRATAPIWPPVIEADEHLTEAFRHLHVEPWLALGLTVILVLSSFTCQFAVWAIRDNNRAGFIRNIAVTLVLGIAFLIGQAYDYTTLGFGLADGVFGTTFFTLTGFHGAHVFGGVIMLSVVLYRGLAGQFSARHHDAVEATSLYWHFVDVVWICLFATLYIL